MNLADEIIAHGHATIRLGKALKNPKTTFKKISRLAREANSTISIGIVKDEMDRARKDVVTGVTRDGD